MKILLLGENKSVHIQKWVQAISLSPNIELHVICFERGVKFENVTYHFLKSYFNNKLDFVFNLFHVKSLIKKIKPDLVHAHYATSYGLLGAFSGKHPFVITGWGADIFDSPRQFVMKKILEYSFSKADAITVLSKITQQEIKKLTAKPVSLIPFGVDADKFLPLRNVNGNIFRVGAVRTFTEKYGIEFLIRGFAKLCLKYNHIELHLIGDGPLKQAFIDLTVELNINDKVTFYGYVNQNVEFDNYLSILNQLNVFVIPSIIDSETFGVAAVEASACELPVIASNVGGLPEVIDDNVTGLIIPPMSEDAIADAIEKLILDKELQLNLGKNGRKKVLEQYFWKQNVAKMIALYNNLINNQRS